MLDLAVVMPVYNEQECIVDVVKSWRDVLANLNINYEIIVLNDGSNDDTGQALTNFRG
ncbi:MAG: glycosyltransferase [Pyrinomonadaceae bacterium]